jgi:hypothetical protein
VTLIRIAVGVDHRDLDAVDETNCVDAHLAILVTIVGPFDRRAVKMRAASRKAIPCLRTLTAFFAGSQVNSIPNLYEMYLRMSRCQVRRRDRVFALSRVYGVDMVMVPRAGMCGGEAAIGVAR